MQATTSRATIQKEGRAVAVNKTFHKKGDHISVFGAANNSHGAAGSGLSLAGPNFSKLHHFKRPSDSMPKGKMHFRRNSISPPLVQTMANGTPGTNLRTDRNLHNEAGLAAPRKQKRGKLPIQLYQKKEVKITGITHLVSLKDNTIFGGDEERQVSSGDVVLIDEHDKYRSRRGPHRKELEKEYEKGDQIYRWFKVLKVKEAVVDNLKLYLRDYTFEEADYTKQQGRSRNEPANIFDLAGRLSSDEPVTSWANNTQAQLRILKGPFEANWFKAKACLTTDKWPQSVTSAPKHEKSLELMKKLVEMRDIVWEDFSKGVTDNIVNEITEYNKRKKSEVQPAKQGDKDLEIYGSSGSKAVTSDVDLPSGGKNTEIGVDILNTKFREKFKVPFDPGTVFDINVYASDWMHGEGPPTYNDKEAKIDLKKETGADLGVEDEKERSDELETWSLVKICRNMTPQEWKEYTKQVLKKYKEGDQKNAMKKKLTSAEWRCLNFKFRVRKKMEEMKTQFDEDIKNLPETKFDEDYINESLEMRASNALYQQKLLQVKKIRLRLEELSGEKHKQNTERIKLAKQLATTIAEALTYANEVYATEGAVLHTVKGKQGAAKKLEKLNKGRVYKLEKVEFNISKEQYLQSVNENVGDTLHSINHHKKNPPYAVYRAGKYLDRMIEASDKLLSEKQAVTLPNYKHLKEVGDESVKAKGGVVGDDPKKVNEQGYFENIKESGMNVVKTETITFGAAVPAKKHEIERNQQK